MRLLSKHSKSWVGIYVYKNAHIKPIVRYIWSFIHLLVLTKATQRNMCKYPVPTIHIRQKVMVKWRAVFPQNTISLFLILCSKALQSTGTDGRPLKRESSERFTRCTLCCRHGMYILGVIKKIVGKIDDTEYLEKLFDDLSDLHRRLGVEASGMDIFGKVFCKVYTPKNWRCETWSLCLENLAF